MLILPEESNDGAHSARALGYPFVVIDPIEPLDDGVPTVSAANALGGRAATEHLLFLGHRRVGAITGVADWLASVERLNGYRSAFAAAGLLPDPVLVVESDWAVEGGERRRRGLLDRHEPPTAIFAFNDDMAVGALRPARSRRLRVSEDLSVVHSAIPASDDHDSGLTTVRQPPPRWAAWQLACSCACSRVGASGHGRRAADPPRRTRVDRLARRVTVTTERLK